MLSPGKFLHLLHNNSHNSNSQTIDSVVQNKHRLHSFT